jgi:GntR family transcriptional regulator
MKLDLQEDRSIYLQIAERIKDNILQNALEEEEQVPSTNQLAALYRINPATAGKGINLLVDEGILYKRRGIGMFVASGARDQIRRRRKELFFEDYVQPLLSEAGRLGISEADLCSMIMERAKEQAKEGAIKS